MWAINSRNNTIRGHLHHGLGGVLSKLLLDHPDVTILPTPEHKSSKSCCCCHGPVRLASVRREGTVRKVNGAVECTSPACALFGYTLPRDINACKSVSFLA